MPTCEIITVGTELTEGSRTNTNATWLAKRVTSVGITVERITSVRDEPGEIAKAVSESVGRKVDLLIVGGGLGPTPDDRTLEGVCKGLGTDLVLSEKALKFVRESYSRMHAQGLVRSRRLNKARKKMAFIPRGADPLFNPVGAAPGVRLKHRGTHILCLPGVPAEMRAIFKQYAGDILKEIKGERKASVEITVERGDESLMAPLFDKLIRRFPGVEVRSYPSRGKVRVVLVANTRSRANAAKSELLKLLGGRH
ncbi:MAG: damage-inducible protein CinA [Hadesarchaea archaeon]|nr:damage-inducible protein CinA [Hadesarchaea archaeon]